MSLAQCKRCRRAIRWATTVAGKHQALDAIAKPDRGTVRINDAGRAETLTGEVLELARAFDEDLFVPHAATCSRRR